MNEKRGSLLRCLIRGTIGGPQAISGRSKHTRTPHTHTHTHVSHAVSWKAETCREHGTSTPKTHINRHHRYLSHAQACCTWDDNQPNAIARGQKALRTTIVLNYTTPSVSKLWLIHHQLAPHEAHARRAGMDAVAVVSSAHLPGLPWRIFQLMSGSKFRELPGWLGTAMTPPKSLPTDMGQLFQDTNAARRNQGDRPRKLAEALGACLQQTVGERGALCFEGTLFWLAFWETAWTTYFFELLHSGTHGKLQCDSRSKRSLVSIAFGHLPRLCCLAFD